MLPGAPIWVPRSSWPLPSVTQSPVSCLRPWGESRKGRQAVPADQVLASSQRCEDSEPLLAYTRTKGLGAADPPFPHSTPCWICGSPRLSAASMPRLIAPWAWEAPVLEPLA